MKIIIVTHGTVAISTCHSLEMIAGRMGNVHAISFMDGESPETLHEHVKDQLDAFGNEPALMFVDIFGGTPFQICAGFLKRPNTRCITGFNLPMLIHAATSDFYGNIDDFVTELIQVGRNNIKPISSSSSKSIECD